jgi:hypothetical protein
MPATIRRIVPIALSVLTVGLLAGPAAAQPRDPLPEVRERLKIEGQRVEKQIRDGRMRAYRLLRNDPNGAYDAIKELIGTLRKDTSLSEERHETLEKQLQRDIEILRALASARRPADLAAQATRAEVRRAPDPRATDPARAAYDTAAARINTIQNRVADSRTSRVQSGDRFMGTIAEVNKSAVPAASDYDLPPDWLEKTKRRSPAAKLTSGEKAILEALKKLVKVDYNMDTFQSVIDHLSKQMGLNILTSKQALEEANVTYDSPITLRFNKPITARTALKRVLGDLGLTYVIRNENIEVTTIARAREMLTTRTYYIGDLMGVASPILPAIVNQFQALEAIGSIISSIQGIDPESWQSNGGAGTIAFDPVRMSLVIKQTAEMHYLLGGGH